MFDREKIMRRVRKMLAMAEGKANANESATAAAMAERLMRKYQLSQAEVLAQEIDKDAVAEDVVDNGTKTMPRWVDWISVGCARANECEVRRRGNGAHVFYGVAGDSEVAAEMMRYLVKEVNRLARAFPGDRRAKGQFRTGAASALQERLLAIAAERKREFEQTATGTSLVLRKQDVIRQSAGAFRYRSSGRHRVYDGYSQGRAAGDRISLNKQIRNGANSAALTGA